MQLQKTTCCIHPNCCNPAHPVSFARHVEKRLDPALVRLYDPILPRAFGAANSEIRRNAINLLVAAFPICVSNYRGSNPLPFHCCSVAEQHVPLNVLDCAVGHKDRLGYS